MKKKVFILIALAVALSSLNLNARAFQKISTEKQTSAKAQRHVKGHTLISDSLPPIRIKFGKAFKYVGSHSFILYDSAQVEQYFFVAADHQRIKGMFMVQFESYLPTNSYTYDYKINETVKLGGLDFMYNPAVANVPAFRKQYPNSDAGRAAGFLEGKGYKLEGMDIMFERFVRLVDETKRSELLIIYYENMSSTGLTAADLSEQGRAASQRDKIFQGLKERALKGFTILK